MKFRLSQILKFVMIIYLLGVFTLMILDCISYARIRKADSIADSENPSQFRIVSFLGGFGFLSNRKPYWYTGSSFHDDNDRTRMPLPQMQSRRVSVKERKIFRWASMRRSERQGSTLMDKRSVCIANRVRFLESSVNIKINLTNCNYIWNYILEQADG